MKPTKWFDNANNNVKYNSDNDDDKDISRLATRYPTATLQLQEGNESPQVRMGMKEESEVVPKDDTMIVEDDNEDEEENDKSDNHDYSKQGIFGKYTIYGYTSNRTTTNETSTNIKDTVDTNKET